MTTSSRAAFDVTCRQLFTKRHGEFTSGNARVTARHPAGGVSQHSHSNRMFDDLRAIGRYPAKGGRAITVGRNP